MERCGLHRGPSTAFAYGSSSSLAGLQRRPPIWCPRPVDAVAVPLTRTHVGDVGVPAERVHLVEADAQLDVRRRRTGTGRPLRRPRRTGRRSSLLRRRWRPTGKAGPATPRTPACVARSSTSATGLSPEDDAIERQHHRLHPGLRAGVRPGEDRAAWNQLDRAGGRAQVGSQAELAPLGEHQSVIDLRGAAQPRGSVRSGRCVAELDE